MKTVNCRLLAVYYYQILIKNVQHLPVKTGVVLHHGVGGGTFHHRAVEQKIAGAAAGVAGKERRLIDDKARASEYRLENAATVWLVSRSALEGFKIIERGAINYDAPAWLIGRYISITANVVERQVLG